MHLTRHQRKQLFDGQPAKITFDGAKPYPLCTSPIGADHA